MDTQIRIVNKDGKEVAKNGKEVGEIIVKGKSVTSHEFQSVTPNGWMYTGDMGTMDADGKIHVTHNQAHEVKNNYSISIIDIEIILNHHPSVQEVSVILQPDAELGEIAHVFVVLSKAISQAQLLNDIKQQSSSPIPPIHFTFMDELPKTMSGKILKKQLESQ